MRDYFPCGPGSVGQFHCFRGDAAVNGNTRQPLRPLQGAVGNKQLGDSGPGQSVDDASRRAACAQYQHVAAPGIKPCAVAQRPQETYAVGVVAGQTPVAVDDGVDRPGGGSPVVHLVEEGYDRFLVGNGHVDAQGSRSAQASDELAQAVGRNVPGFVSAIEPDGVQRRLLEKGRNGVTDGVTDDA